MVETIKDIVAIAQTDGVVSLLIAFSSLCVPAVFSNIFVEMLDDRVFAYNLSERFGYFLVILMTIITTIIYYFFWQSILLVILTMIIQVGLSYLLYDRSFYKKFLVVFIDNLFKKKGGTNE